MRKSEAWGYIDFDYEIHCPDGESVHACVSPHDGIGVFVEGGQSWGIDAIGEGAYRLGTHTEVTINKVARTVDVDTTEAANRIPHILCGLVLLVDPQNRWGKELM
jgi:hypothetical protein